MLLQLPVNRKDQIQAFYQFNTRISWCPRDRGANWQLVKIESPRNNPLCSICHKEPLYTLGSSRTVKDRHKMDLNFRLILTLFLAMVMSFGSVYCSQGVTRMTQDPNVIIGHVQEIVLDF